MWFVDFLFLPFNKSVNEIISKSYDKQRLVQGVPDTPFSLMEGLGGQICLFSDFLSSYKNKNEENLMYFPGFEI